MPFVTRQARNRAIFNIIRPIMLWPEKPPPRYDTEIDGGARVSSMRKSFEQSAWQIGVARYLSTLPPEYKDAFKAPSSAEECLRLLQDAQSRNRKFDRLVAILQPLVEPLKRFEASVDVLVQTYSSVASPIWGPIRLLITVASTRLSTLHNVVILLERLVEPLKRFHNYETLFKHNSALRHAIGALYCDLIEFCTRVISHQTRSPFKNPFASFDKDVTEITDKIRHHWAEVDIAANAANLVEAKAARIREEVQRVYDFQRDVNRWLAPATAEDDLNRLSSVCAQGSCQWILGTETMREFRSDHRPSALRISAYPGGGKSVAAGSIVQHLQQEGKIVLYFFCKSTDAEKSFTTSIIRTLVWQLLQADQALYEVLAPIYNRSGRQIADSEVLAFEMFDTVFKATHHEEVVLVLDALDECHDTASLITLLTDTQSATQNRMKLLVTSRDDPELVELLTFCTSEIALQTNTQPLAKYIENGIESLPLPILPYQRNDIRKAVQSASNGLWLFASLMMQELRKASSISEVYDQIRTVPDGLAQLYNSIMRAREKGFTKMHIRMAQQLYLWLRMADYVPQSGWRARGTPGLDDEVIHTIFQYATKSPSEVFKPMELILRLCSPLVTTRLLHADHVVTFVEGEPHHCSSFVAEVFHQTADQYLQWCQEAISSDVPVCMQPRRLADLHRAACAAWYFGAADHFQHSLHHLRERPRSEAEDCWLEMSCGLWAALKIDRLRRDLTSQEMDDAEELCDGLVTFLESDRCLGFVEASIILHYSGQSTLLADNVEENLEASGLSPGSSRQKYDFLVRLIEARDLFKADLIFALKRFPASNSTHNVNEIDALKPEHFEKRPRASKIFALARRYRWLGLAPGAVSINGFLTSGKI